MWPEASTQVRMPTRFCTGSTVCSNHTLEVKDTREREAITDCKEFVVVGNGPSGLALSYLLSGHWPYYTGQSQDEFLHTRLTVEPHLSLVEQDLEFLSDGLEGRSNNPVSLLLDALQKPDADLGVELPSLLQWRRVDQGRVPHVVLGRGKPGGIWQTLDGGLLTVSLGGWMELPNLTMKEWKQSNNFKETNARESHRRTNVACLSQYYQDYVTLMGLTDNFENNTVVTSVRQIKCVNSSTSCTEDKEQKDVKMSPIPEKEPNIVVTVKGPTEEIFTFDVDENGSDDLSSQCSSLTGVHRRSLSSISMDSSLPPASSLPSPYERLRAPVEDQGCSLRCEYDCDFQSNWDPILNPSLFGSYKSSSSMATSMAAYSASLGDFCRRRMKPCHTQTCEEHLFEVCGYRIREGTTQPFKYMAKNVVLATGQADLPNKLEVVGSNLPFVLHSLSEFESVVTAGNITVESPPVMVVGAGLSAADAIINTQGYGFSIAHVFRKCVDDPQLIFNKLPAALYPEYHNVHRLMAGGSLETNGRGNKLEEMETEKSRYRAWAETEVVRIDPDHRVTVSSKHGQEVIQVSYIVVLIGACPNLEFLECRGEELGRIPGQQIDRNNPIDIEVYSHQSVRVPGLFAMGPLTGDNFVRFLQGGALAIANHVQQQRRRRKEEAVADRPES